MKTYYDEHWWSFKDVVEHSSINATPYHPDNTLKNWLTDYATNLGITTDFTADEEKLFALTYARNYGNYVAYSKVEDGDEMSDTIALSYIYRFMNVLNATREKYTTILNIYRDNMSKLMDRLKNIYTGTSRYNDTPQDSGDYEDDSHTTSITSTSTEVQADTKTIMEKIKEIQTSLQDVLLMWSNEFGKLFLEENNL